MDLALTLVTRNVLYSLGASAIVVLGVTALVAPHPATGRRPI